MTIFKLKNIKININIFLILVLALYLFFGYVAEISIIFISVLFHEISHLVTAKRLGIEVRELEIFPFGGVVKFDSIIGPDPKIEIIVALVGPVFNLIIAGVFHFIAAYFLKSHIIQLIVTFNIYMGIFNLLPIFPLDGGRILRGSLSYLLGFKSATNKLTYITYGFSTLLVIIEIFLYSLKGTGLFLILIAIFITIAANKEKKMAAFIFIKEIVEKKLELFKEGVMKAQHLIVINTVSAKLVLESFLPRKFHIIIVVDKNGNTMGILNENELLDGVIRFGIDIEIEKLLNDNEKC